MAIDQKRAYALIKTYFPDAADDFSNIYVIVDAVIFGNEAKKMPLSTLFSAAIHTESDLKTFTGSSFSLNFEDEGGQSFNDGDYRLDLMVYKIDESSGNTYKTTIPILNENKTPTGFSFDIYKDYGQTIYVDYKAETR